MASIAVEKLQPSRAPAEGQRDADGSEAWLRGLCRYRDHPSDALGMVSLCRFHQNIHQGLSGSLFAKILASLSDRAYLNDNYHHYGTDLRNRHLLDQSMSPEPSGKSGSDYSLGLFAVFLAGSVPVEIASTRDLLRVRGRHLH
jgi:hypothetical protein